MSNKEITQYFKDLFAAKIKEEGRIPDSVDLDRLIASIIPSLGTSLRFDLTT